MAKSEGTQARFETDDATLLVRIIHDKKTPRSVKEAALARIRQIERGCHKTIYGNYNGYSVSEMARAEEECSTPTSTGE